MDRGVRCSPPVGIRICLTSITASARPPRHHPSSPIEHRLNNSYGGSTSISASRTVLVIGATGQAGRIVVEETSAHGLSVGAQLRNTVRAANPLSAEVEIVEAFPTDATSLAVAPNGIDIVTLTHGRDSNLEHNYYAVLSTPLDALAGRPEVYISLMMPTYISHPSGEPRDWKCRVERLVHACGHPYIIVRPGRLDYQGAGDTQTDLRQGDLVRGQSGVDRHHIAQVLIEGALNPSGEHHTAEASSRPGAPVTDFGTLLTATQSDTVANRGALDQDLVPLGSESAHAQADLARLDA